MKNSRKREHFGEDLEGKILEKKEENQSLNNQSRTTELDQGVKNWKKITRWKNRKDSES